MCVVWVYNRFQQLFSHTKTVSGCDRGFNASLVILGGSILCSTSQCCLFMVSSPSHSQAHNTDTKANSPSECQMGSNSYHFKTLVCLCPGANPVPPDLRADTLSSIREHNAQINSAVTSHSRSAPFFSLHRWYLPLYFLYPEFQVSIHCMWLYNPVCV